MGWTAPQRFVHFRKSSLAMHLQSFLHVHFGFLFQKFCFSDISIIWIELKGWLCSKCGVSYCYEESSLSTSEAFAVVNYTLLCIALMKSERWTIRVFSSGCQQPCLNLCVGCMAWGHVLVCICTTKQPLILNSLSWAWAEMNPYTETSHGLHACHPDLIDGSDFFSSQRSRTVCLNLTGGARI